MEEHIAGYPYGEMDARKWAQEFKRLNPNSDEELMLGWFANAIMTGYDRAKSKGEEYLRGYKVGRSIGNLDNLDGV